MTYKTYLLALLLIVSRADRAFAQNLIMNPSFEDTVAAGPCDIFLECHVQHWADYYSGADYYRYNDAGDSLMLFQMRGIVPRTGRSMAGAYQYGKFSPNYVREYIQGFLKEPLKAGTSYRLEAWVAPNLQSPVIVSAITTLGFAVTDSHYKKYDQLPSALIPESPEVVHTGSPLSENGKWTKISGCFTARGGETKIILGNFLPDSLSGHRIIPGAADSGKYGDLGYYFFDDILLEEVPPPRVSGDVVVCRGTPAQLSADSVEGATYKWNTGATTASIVAKNPGTYTVTVNVPPGCRSTASMRVAYKGCGEPCPEPFVPTAFTPNGDGLNDIFRVANEPSIDFMGLAVFNRWGQKLFHSFKGQIGWDGYYNGAPGESGEYMYMLRYRDCESGEQKIQSGSFSLIR